jgi:zinc/manganese transport system substrate-binding protein
VKVLEKPSGAVTRAQGDMHPYGNPHVWLDPLNGRMIALHLAEKLGSLDPKNAAVYKVNADAFANRLDVAMFGSALVGKFGGPKLWEWDSEGSLLANLRKNSAEGALGGWCGKLARFAGKPIVTYHRSWVYFASRFDLKIVGELEPKPGIDPTPGHVAQMIRTVQSNGVRVILQERYYSTRNAQFVAQRTGATVVVAPGSVTHEPAAKDYISLFDTIVDRVAAALAK